MDIVLKVSSLVEILLLGLIRRRYLFILILVLYFQPVWAFKSIVKASAVSLGSKRLRRMFSIY